MRSALERFKCFLDAHPAIGSPTKSLIVLLVGIEFFAWRATTIPVRIATIAGTILIWLSIAGFFIWIFGGRIDAMIVLVTFMLGYALQLTGWIQLIDRREKRP